MQDKASSRELTLFVRANCGLCDHMTLALELLRPRFKLAYTKIDIDADPALVERFGTSVPVLMEDDVEICAGHCDPTTIENYLATAP